MVDYIGATLHVLPCRGGETKGRKKQKAEGKWEGGGLFFLNLSLDNLERETGLEIAGEGEKEGEREGGGENNLKRM